MPYELTYYIDSTNVLSFQQISASKFSGEFRQHTSYKNKDFKANASYWIRLPIQHKTESKKIWLVEFYDQTIDHLEAYVPQEDGSYQSMLVGDSRLFSQRTFRHKNFEILLDMKSNKVMYYYFKVQSHEFADVRIAFRSLNRFCLLCLKRIFLIWNILWHDPDHQLV